MGNIASQEDFLSFHVHWTSPFRKDCHGINRSDVAAFACRGCLGRGLPSIALNDVDLLRTAPSPPGNSVPQNWLRTICICGDLM